MEPHELFSINLRRLRLKANLSQEALGDVCKLHRTEISLLERGRRDPRLTTIVRLARGLQVPLGALLVGIE